MAKGILYITKTAVPGLIKIGKCQKDQFENRMSNLENNGYRNVTGLKRCFAIEVDGYDEKELLIHEIFAKSQIGNTEMFALDENLAIQLFTSLEGKQVYPNPKVESKVEMFDKATERIQIEEIPDGIYTYKNRPKRQVGEKKTYTAILSKENGKLILKAGSEIVDRDNSTVKGYSDTKKKAKIKNDVLIEDLECDSLSMAAVIVSGTHVDGWKVWKDSNGNSLDYYRKNIVNEEE